MNTSSTQNAMPGQTGFSRLSICVVFLSLSGLSAACTKNMDLLPHSVYFLSGPRGHYQVWRLEADGTTTSELSDEQFGVDSFSVSRADGSLAYVTDNQLFLVGPDGGNRQLVADKTMVDPDAFPGFFTSPSFSPDGKTLAYGSDGLHLYDVASGEDERVLTDGGNLLGEPFIFVKENYAPGPWSPSGDKLLIIMGYFEGSTLAVMESSADQPFRRLRSHDPVCCTFHWTPDGSSLFVANPWYGNDWPGLWRYDAETGEEFHLVATHPGQSRFVGWPVQLHSGDLLYFYGEKFTFEEGIPLVMVQSNPDGGDRTQIRPEEFHISDALWADDGSLVLMDKPIGNQTLEGGSAQIVLARPDGSELQVLLDVEPISQMEWGP